MTNEILKDAELDRVAGGTYSETADDSRFLNSLNGSTDRYGDERILYGNHDGEIVRGWAKVGVQALIYSGSFFNGGSYNKYFINGNQVTQEQARQHAMNVTGHYMKRSDWEW
ncbi:MAG: hypothetical protein IJL14_06945 [Selenomonadaceae bacterium]|nr:hypothetical protein [Selenomonadaceae bacterium]